MVGEVQETNCSPKGVFRNACETKSKMETIRLSVCLPPSLKLYSVMSAALIRGNLSLPCHFCAVSEP